MNVTSYPSPTTRAETSAPLVTSWQRVGGLDVWRLEGAEEWAWWAWLLTEVGVATVIVAGDVSLLMLFFTRKLLGQSTNILVFSVAVADLLAGLVVLPLDILQRLLSETSGYMCKGYFYFSNVSKTAVIYTVTMLAMERIVAAISTSFRILSPGRCLFFSSLTWFFAAAYNIWSVVLYDTRLVGHPFQRLELEDQDIRQDAVSWSIRGGVVGFNYSTHVCFSSTRFQWLVDVFELLDFFVTFFLPVTAAGVLFGVFWRKRETVRAPGRPYRSSTSVIIFTFALFVSFCLCHLPLEIATLHVHKRDVTARSDDFLVYKVCQMTSFTRGFWDVFIFGVFRHYVCRKERALAVIRGSRYGTEGRGAEEAGGEGGQRGVTSPTSLTVPVTGPPPSTSLLDSDQEVTITPHRSSISDQ
ncbi:hypothetical protein ACOMHN_023952 [Nucella lapillus]